MAANGKSSAPTAEPNRLAITACVVLATVMQALDTTIANVSLPYIQGSVAANQDEIEWILTSYIVAAAIMTPPTGFLAGRFGVKRLFLTSIVGFTIASMLCGMASSLYEIVLFRLVQGGFGAALVPLSQSVLLDIYPRERQGQATAYWGMAIMVGPIIGPVLGGWLTFNYSWRWVFYQCPDRHSRVCRNDGVFARNKNTSRKARLVWLRHIERGDRRLTDSARPRRGARLVRLPGDPRRGGHQRLSLLAVPRAYLYGKGAVREAAPVS
jgi:DHA2 family multidrug resistance protein